MMAKGLALFALLALVLGSCSAKEDTPAMYIQPAELTEEEEAVARLLGAGANQHLFDVALDGTAKKVSVSTYELVDGGWERLSGGGGMALAEGVPQRGRMAFGFEDLGGEYRETVQFGKDFTAVSYGSQKEVDSTLGRSIAFLSDRTEVVYEKEIPLAIQINTSGNMMISYDVEYFNEPEVYTEQSYEHVYALAVTFSQKPLS